MKRKILALVTAAVILLATGCGNGARSQNPGARTAAGNPNLQSVNDVIQQQIAKEDAQKSAASDSTAASSSAENLQNTSAGSAGADTGDVNSGAQTASAGNEKSNDGSSVSTDTGAADTSGTASDGIENAGTGPSTVSDDNIDYDHPDIDLTQMSDTMAYAEMANLFYNREKTKDYIGKVVKFSGTYAISDPDQYGETYHFIVYWDATACCQLGGEFVMKNEDDYPEVFSDLTVVGVYRAYIDPADGNEYVHIDACIPVNE